jgi:hypothetical protein
VKSNQYLDGLSEERDHNCNHERRGRPRRFCLFWPVAGSITKNPRRRGPSPIRFPMRISNSRCTEKHAAPRRWSPVLSSFRTRNGGRRWCLQLRAVDLGTPTARLSNELGAAGNNKWTATSTIVLSGCRIAVLALKDHITRSARQKIV